MQTWVEPAGAVKADLQQCREAFETAVRSGDATGAAAAYTEDATLVAPAGELLHGRAAIERFWQTGVDLGIHDLELVVLDVRLRGDLALEIGEYALRVAAESGSPAVNRGRYLVVHRLGSNGCWERAAEMFSPDASVGGPRPRG